MREFMQIRKSSTCPRLVFAYCSTRPSCHVDRHQSGRQFRFITTGTLILKRVGLAVATVRLHAPLADAIAAPEPAKPAAVGTMAMGLVDTNRNDPFVADVPTWEPVVFGSRGFRRVLRKVKICAQWIESKLVAVFLGRFRQKGRDG